MYVVRTGLMLGVHPKPVLTDETREFMQSLLLRYGEHSLNICFRTWDVLPLLKTVCRNGTS